MQQQLDLKFVWNSIFNQLKNKVDYKTSVELLCITDKMAKVEINVGVKDEIHDYMTINLFMFCSYFINSDDTYGTNIFLKNIIRLQNLLDNRNKFDTLLTFKITRIYLNLKSPNKVKTDKDKKISDSQDQIICLIKKYTTTNNFDYVNKIFGLALEFNHYGIIEKLKDFVDLKKFLKDGYKKDNHILNSLNKMRGNKLVNYLINIYQETGLD